MDRWAIGIASEKPPSQAVSNSYGHGGSASPPVSIVAIVLLLGLVSLLAGCRHANRPARPHSLGVDAGYAYSAEEFKAAYKDYHEDVKEGRMASAQEKRDVMINRVETDVEANYREFEAKLSTSRAAGNLGADIVELGLSAAITQVGASDVKDLLAASLTGFKGTRLSVDKNFFREKTTEALIAKMQAGRDSIRNRITQKLALDVKQYPFEEAWHDLVEYFYAGTLPSALQQLANDAGQEASAAKKDAQKIDIQRAATAQEADAAVRIRSNYAKLYEDVMNAPARSTQQTNAMERLKSTLILLGEGEAAIKNQSDPKALLTLLQQHIRQSLQNPADIAVIDKALGPK